MYIETLSHLKGTKLNIWTDFLALAGLEADPDHSQVVLVWEDGRLIATGCRRDHILKCIAVDSHRRGEDLTATVLTALRQGAFLEGHRHLFLYTKPENRQMFTSLFFHPVAQVPQVLLMENQKEGIRSFLSSLPLSPVTGIVGAIVMNCNPFTLGHRYLIETAAGECDHLYIFVLSEDKSRFTAADRMEMVRLGTQDLSNVSLLPTGPYLISSATFPTYFLKDREQAGQIHCLLDIEIFAKYFVPHFSICRRYVGTEPLSPVTRQYNEALRAYLPERGMELKEVPRLERNAAPVSASLVRQLIDAKDRETVKTLVPQTTYEYLQSKGLL